jgi:hypothetical protein
MSEDPIHDLLQSLAEADAAAEAAPEIELRLRKKFRSWKRRRAWRQAAVWAPVAAAMIVMIFALANRKHPSAPVNEEVMAHDTVPNESGVAVLETSPPVTLTTPARVRKHAASSQQSKPAEIVTEFFPLMDPAPPLGRGQLFRVELPASAMQMVGLPVHEEHLSDAVQADVLVGEEGLPRAIRFVKFEMK